MENYITIDQVKMGQRIKAVRKKSGLTVEKFAEALMVSDQAVYKWQRGETIPDIYNIKQISLKFKVSTDYLILGGGDDKESSPLHFRAKSVILYI